MDDCGVTERVVYCWDRSAVSWGRQHNVKVTQETSLEVSSFSDINV